MVSAPLCSILRGRRTTFCSARGVMYASGVPLASRGLRTSVLYFAWQAHCSARGVMYVSGVPLASRGLRTSVLFFAWQARDFLLGKGRDVCLWRPSGVPWSPRLCALFCVAGAALAALWQARHLLVGAALIHTYIPTYIHTYIRTYIQTYMTTCVYLIGSRCLEAERHAA